jgi:hypothetical protein
MYKHSSSIRSEFVAQFFSYDYVYSYFVELALTEDKRTNGGDTRSTFDDELDSSVFLGGLRTIKQYVRSMLLFSTSKRFLMLSLFNFESTKIIASFVLKFFMLTYEVAIRISWQNNNTTIFNP